jgi:hypothetical protein
MTDTLHTPERPPVERTLAWAVRWALDHLGLVAGSAGLLVALASALGPLKRAQALPGDAIATVDGRAIARTTFDRAIAALEADKRNPVTAGERRTALSRLVDEELLVRRALDLGLAEAEPAVRKALIDAMLQLATATAGGKEPPEAELRAFHAGRPTLFAGEPLVTIALAGFPKEAAERAQRMAGLLRARVPFDKAVAETGPDAMPAPPALTPLGNAGDYVGPTIRDAASWLAPGEVAGPLEVAGRVVFVQMIDRKTGERQAFEAVRGEVLEAWRRNEKDQALEAYLARLRAKAKVLLATDAPR